MYIKYIESTGNSVHEIKQTLYSVQISLQLLLHGILYTFFASVERTVTGLMEVTDVC